MHSRMWLAKTQSGHQDFYLFIYLIKFSVQGQAQLKSSN